MSINIKGPGAIGGVADSRSAKADSRERPAAETAKADEAKAADDVALSPEARQLQEAENRVKGLPDIDSAKVEQIRAAIAEGRYPVDPERIASKIIELEGELGLKD